MTTAIAIATIICVVGAVGVAVATLILLIREPHPAPRSSEKVAAHHRRDSQVQQGERFQADRFFYEFVRVPRLATSTVENERPVEEWHEPEANLDVRIAPLTNGNVELWLVRPTPVTPASHELLELSVEEAADRRLSYLIPIDIQDANSSEIGHLVISAGSVANISIGQPLEFSALSAFPVDTIKRSIEASVGITQATWDRIASDDGQVLRDRPLSSLIHAMTIR